MSTGNFCAMFSTFSINLRKHTFDCECKLWSSHAFVYKLDVRFDLIDFESIGMVRPMNFNIKPRKSWTPDYEPTNARMVRITLIIKFNIIWMLPFKLIRIDSIQLIVIIIGGDRIPTHTYGFFSFRNSYIAEEFLQESLFLLPIWNDW